MLLDRAGRDEILLTQETAARQLGVRRAGVNEGMGWLERLSVIDNTRGRVRVLNREALEEAACVCYRGFEGDMHWHEGAELHGEGLAR